MTYPPPRADQWDLWIVGTLSVVLFSAVLLIHVL